MGSLALTGSKSVQRKGFFPVMPGVASRALRLLLPLRLRQDADSCAVECVQGDRRPSCSAPCFRPKKSPRSSSSRSRAKAATWSLPRSSSTNCAASPTSTAFCWSSTRSSAAWGAPARCSRREHFGVDPGHHRAGQGHRQRPAAGRDGRAGRNHGLDAGRARVDVRRESGGGGGVARDHRTAGAGTDRQRRHASART